MQQIQFLNFKSCSVKKTTTIIALVCYKHYYNYCKKRIKKSVPPWPIILKCVPQRVSVKRENSEKDLLSSKLHVNNHLMLYCKLPCILQLQCGTQVVCVQSVLFVPTLCRLCQCQYLSKYTQRMMMKCLLKHFFFQSRERAFQDDGI